MSQIDGKAVGELAAECVERGIQAGSSIGFGNYSRTFWKADEMLRALLSERDALQAQVDGLTKERDEAKGEAILKGNWAADTEVALLRAERQRDRALGLTVHDHARALVVARNPDGVTVFPDHVRDMLRALANEKPAATFHMICEHCREPWADGHRCPDQRGGGAATTQSIDRQMVAYAPYRLCEYSLKIFGKGLDGQDYHVADTRGWGALVGTGGSQGLSETEAIRIQRQTGQFIVDAMSVAAGAIDQIASRVEVALATAEAQGATWSRARLMVRSAIIAGAIDG